MDQTGLKERLWERLQDLNWHMTDLADETGDPYRSVTNWIRKDHRVPGDFLCRYVSVVPVNPRWLLTGEGSPEPREEGLGERLMSVMDALVRSRLNAETKSELLWDLEHRLREEERGGQSSGPGNG